MIAAGEVQEIRRGRTLGVIERNPPVRRLHVADRRIAGIGETYITGSVSNQDIIFWIYPDSAALQVGRRHRAFGFPKRESLLDTATEFLDELMKVVDGPDAAARN